MKKCPPDRTGRQQCHHRQPQARPIIHWHPWTQVISSISIQSRSSSTDQGRLLLVQYAAAPLLKALARLSKSKKELKGVNHFALLLCSLQPHTFVSQRVSSNKRLHSMRFFCATRWVEVHTWSWAPVYFFYVDRATKGCFLFVSRDVLKDF